MIESNRTTEQAKRDFAAGRLTHAVLIRVPMQRHAWTLRLSGKKGDSGMLLEVQTLEPKVFTSLDDAIDLLDEIGFEFEQLQVK